MVLFGLCILKCFRNGDVCSSFTHEYHEYGKNNYVLRAILRVLGVISRWCGFGREMQGSSVQSVYLVHLAAMGAVVKGCLESSSGPQESLFCHPCAQKASRTCDVVNGAKTQVLQLTDRKKHHCSAVCSADPIFTELLICIAVVYLKPGHVPGVELSEYPPKQHPRRRGARVVGL